MDMTLPREYSPDLIIAIFRNAKPDFQKLDLRPIGLIVLPVWSDAFKEYVQHLNPERFDQHFGKIDKDFVKFKSYRPHVFALVPVNFQKAHTNLYMKVRMALLMMFPSDFNILGLIDFKRDPVGDVFYNHISRQFDYKVQRISDGSERFFLSLERDGGTLDDISAFVIHFVERFKELEHFEVAFQSYVNGYDQLDLRMTFVNWFMAFDALSAGTTEVTYRLSRLAAVLNATDSETGQTIFKNFNEFYKLRSAIVHGNSANEYGKALKVYYPAVQALLARTLIEIVQHTFVDRKKFSDLITQSGFGMKNKLSEGYREYNVNPTIKNLALQPVVKFSTASKGIDTANQESKK